MRKTVTISNQKNLDTVHRVYEQTVETYLETYTGEPFDFIYADPPYGNAVADLAYINRGTYLNNTSFWQQVRDALSPAGVLAVSINDKSMPELDNTLTAVFGKENRLNSYVWIKAGTVSFQSPFPVIGHEIILFYAKNRSKASNYPFRETNPKHAEILELASQTKQQAAETLTGNIKELWEHVRPDTSWGITETVQPYQINSMSSTKSYGDQRNYTVLHPVTKQPCRRPRLGWGWTQKRFQKAIKQGHIEFGKDHKTIPKYRRYITNQTAKLPTNILQNIRSGGTDLQTLGLSGAFSYPKPVQLIGTLLGHVAFSRKSVRMLDLFAGSGTGLQAVLYHNQKKKTPVTYTGVTRKEHMATGQTVIDLAVWPRIQTLITGKKQDGTALPKKYCAKGTVEIWQQQGETQETMAQPVEHIRATL